MLYIGSTYSLATVNNLGDYQIKEISLTPDEARQVIERSTEWVSGVGNGNADTVISELKRYLEMGLNIEIPFNQISMPLGEEDELLLAKYIGPRLPEVSTTLPEGAEIQFKLLTFRKL